MNALRIAFVTPEYVTETYFSGGLANYIHRVSKALVSLEHEVHVITLSEKSQPPFEHEGVKVHQLSLGKLHRRLNRLTRRKLSGSTRWFEFSLQAYRKLNVLHQQHPFDIVQFPNSRACGLVSGLLFNVPQVTRISCYRPAWNEQAGVQRDLDTKATEWLEWLQLRFGQHIYGPSYTLQKMLAQEAGIQNIRVIRTPFYLETVEWDSSIYDSCLKDKDYLLFFGRFQLHKGFHILAQALPQVLRQHSNCYAVLVGLDIPSSLAPSMKDYALSLAGEYADRLIFIGQTPHTQLYPIISGAKLVVLPSLVDNLPNTCLEAMALGKPVVGTIGTSLDELITDEETGFLVPPNNIDALAKRINQAWMHPALAPIGEAAKQKLLEFSPERTVKDVLFYYEQILGISGQSKPTFLSVLKPTKPTKTSLISSPLAPDLSTLVDMKEKAIAFWLKLWDQETGGFRFASHQPATLMATAYCVLGLELARGLSQLSHAQREAIIAFLIAGVQPDGSFKDPLFRPEDILSKEHDLSYFQDEITTFCQQALDALSSPPPPPRIYLDNRDTIEGFIRFCESLPWQNPWLDSNPVMFALSQLCHDAERHHKSELLEVVDAALDWLDAHQSPETGLWQSPYEVSLTNAMAATFHFTFFYGYRNRPIQHAEQIIDSCLKLQESHGLFSGHEIGQTCLDYDAIDLLAKASLETVYRSHDVQAAMIRGYEALLGLHNSDGGFANCKERVKYLNGRKARLLRRMGFGKFAPSSTHVLAEGTYNVCWRLLSCDSSQSNAFSTWFRLISVYLAVLNSGLDILRSDIGLEELFYFRNLPFLGYHKLK
ncbi:MAG: glycosyltransferase [Cyanothece sp. SIO1E1]|nr:glycosyltransferase [Cyanothece sp. SIO1E1]